MPSVSVEFGAAAYSVEESDDTDTTETKENEVSVTVKLSADPERTVTIPITKTDQDGATSADYSGVPASVTFNSGDTEKSFTFTATADTVDDDGESVKLTFGYHNLPAGVTEGTTNETVVSINDDDLPADVDVAFEQSSYTVAEGSTVTVKVTLSEDPERTVTIPITKTDQDGASSADYSGVPGQRHLQRRRHREVLHLHRHASDSVDDDGESVKLTFGTLPTGVTEGTTKETVVSITDDDVPSVSVEFGAGGLQRGGVRRHGHHGDQGERGLGHGDPVRRPGAHGDHPHHQDRPGRRHQRRLLRRPRQRHLQQRRHREVLHLHRHRRHRGRRR